VLAGIVHGASIAFWVALIAIGLALVLGILFGMFAGYYGNKFEVGWGEMILLSIGAFFLFYYIIYFSPSWQTTITLIVLFGFFKLGMMALMERIYPSRPKLNLPVDNILTKFLEVFKSIPTLIILILLLGIITKPSVVSIAVCLGILIWVRIARYIRAEVLAIRESEFILAQKALGSSDLVIMIKHCLPKALPPVMVSVIFLAGSVILMEATLSFLGIGLSIEQVSWGSLLNDSRSYLGAWWMVLFPGLCLFLIIAALANESKYWSEKINPKNRI